MTTEDLVQTRTLPTQIRRVNELSGSLRNYGRSARSTINPSLAAAGASGLFSLGLTQTALSGGTATNVLNTMTGNLRSLLNPLASVYDGFKRWFSLLPGGLQGLGGIASLIGGGFLLRTLGRSFLGVGAGTAVGTAVGSGVGGAAVRGVGLRTAAVTAGATAGGVAAATAPSSNVGIRRTALNALRSPYTLLGAAATAGATFAFTRSAGFRESVANLVTRSPVGAAFLFPTQLAQNVARGNDLATADTVNNVRQTILRDRPNLYTRPGQSPFSLTNVERGVLGLGPSQPSGGDTYNFYGVSGTDTQWLNQSSAADPRIDFRNNGVID